MKMFNLKLLIIVLIASFTGASLSSGNIKTDGSITFFEKFKCLGKLPHAELDETDKLLSSSPRMLDSILLPGVCRNLKWILQT